MNKLLVSPEIIVRQLRILWIKVIHRILTGYESSKIFFVGLYSFFQYINLAWAYINLFYHVLYKVIEDEY